MAKIYNKRNLLQEKIDNGHSVPVNVYLGKAKSNMNNVSVRKHFEEDVLVKPDCVNWKNSEKFMKLRKDFNDMHKKYLNTQQDPSVTEIAKFFLAAHIDITRMVEEQADYTSLLATEFTNEAYQKVITADNFFPFVGKFEEIRGTGDSAPLIEHATGEQYTATLSIKALGHDHSLSDMLFNDFYEFQKVLDAVAYARVDKRNDAIIGKIVNTSFTAKQSVAADTTSGATSDLLLYNTLDKADDALRKLLDPRTDREINVSNITLLVNSHDTKRINRVINGQLNAFGKTSARNVPALPIDNIIEYDHGITDGWTYGKETLSYKGVTQGTAYMLVPREYLWVLNKRGLTRETSEGNALSFSQEKNGWYYVDTVFDDLFLGSSKSGTTLSDGYGAIVKITLPA